MASLMENLISVLRSENEEYQQLLELSKKKTPVIVEGKIEELQRITDEEQSVVARINRLDSQREEVVKDIANVLNKDVTTLKLVNIIQMLDTRPGEQQELAKVHDDLRMTVMQMKTINDRNRELINNSREMVAFDINLLHSMKSAPQTANYTKGAYNSGAVMGVESGGFDAKQ